MVDPGYRKMQRDERQARRRLDLERAAQSANARPHALHAGSPCAGFACAEKPVPLSWTVIRRPCLS